MPLSRQHAGLIAINLAALVFGTSALYGKIDISPFWLVAGRALCAMLVLGGLALATRQPVPKGVRCWRALLISGLLLAAHWVTFFMTVQQGSVAIATLTFAAFPVFTVLLDALWQRRGCSIRTLFCSGLIMVAVGLLYDPAASLANRQALGIGLFSALLFALFGRISQDLARNAAPGWISAGQNAVVLLALMPMLFLGGIALPRPDHLPFMLALGIINTALMHQLYFFALQRLSATLASAFLALEPVYAILFAALLFGDPVTPMLFITVGLIVGAAQMLLRTERTS